MTALLPLYYLLVALVGGVVLPFVAFLLFAHVVTEALGWVEGARQRRIERAEALVQHLRGATAPR